MKLLFMVKKGSYVIIAFVISVIHVLSSVHVVAFGHVSNACLEMIGLASFVKNNTIKNVNTTTGKVTPAQPFNFSNTLCL